MAKTLHLALTTTPLPVTVQTHCSKVTIAEDESVTGWPTQNLQIRKPTAGDDILTLTAGKSYTFERSKEGNMFNPGQVIGYISVAAGSTTGVQDEQ